MKYNFKLSIIIPVFNQEELIIKALDSIPSRNDIEIIIVDDKSTDRTRENIMRYMLQHNMYEDEPKAIMLLENEENKGVGVSRNNGIEVAKGKYIMFLDSDDYLYPELDRFINELTGEDIVYYGLVQNNNVRIMPKPKTIKRVCGTVKAIKKEFIGDTRFPAANYAEDWVFNKELLDKQPTIKFTDIYLLHYNHPRKNSLTDIEMEKRKQNNE